MNSEQAGTGNMERGEKDGREEKTTRTRENKRQDERRARTWSVEVSGRSVEKGTMGQGQTKLHWAVLAQDWKRVLRRLSKQPKEASISNPYGDYALHLACYDGQAPPEIIRALIDAFPPALRKENKKGRDPLELASINYRVDGPHRSEVLALLRWHRPGNSPLSDDAAEDSFDNEETSTPMLYADMFMESPPAQMYNTSHQCVICLESHANIAMLPCGHVCLCANCLQTKVMRKGQCPIDRCEVVGLYKVKGDDVIIGDFQRMDSGRALFAN